MVVFAKENKYRVPPQNKQASKQATETRQRHGLFRRGGPSLSRPPPWLRKREQARSQGAWAAAATSSYSPQRAAKRRPGERDIRTHGPAPSRQQGPWGLGGGGRPLTQTLGVYSLRKRPARKPFAKAPALGASWGGSRGRCSRAALSTSPRWDAPAAARAVQSEPQPIPGTPWQPRPGPAPARA